MCVKQRWDAWQREEGDSSQARNRHVLFESPEVWPLAVIAAGRTYANLVMQPLLLTQCLNYSHTDPAPPGVACQSN